MATAALSDAGRYAQSASNTVQNTIRRVQDDAPQDDMVEIHQVEGQRSSGEHPMTQLMHDKHVVKESTRWGVAEHDVSFSGRGGVMFLLMLFALVLSIAAFTSTGWSTSGLTIPAMMRSGSPRVLNSSELQDGKVQLGLWETCYCTGWVPDEPAFHATQAMITIGFILLWVAMLAIALYMCLCLNIIKKTYLLYVVIVGAITAALFLTIGLTVYATTFKNFNIGAEEIGWSYIIALAATSLSFATSLIAFIHLRKTVPVC